MLKRRLVPLEQWVCDTCGEVIETPEQGWLEWVYDRKDGERKARGWRIVHHKMYSPLLRTTDDPDEVNACYQHTDHPGRADMHLHDYVGPCFLHKLYAWLDPGPLAVSEYSGPDIVDLREYTELLRRLTLPHYEEARLYWLDALDDGFFEDADPHRVYAPETLRSVIRRYAPKIREDY